MRMLCVHAGSTFSLDFWLVMVIMVTATVTLPSRCSLYELLIQAMGLLYSRLATSRCYAGYIMHRASLPVWVYCARPVHCFPSEG